MMLESDGSSGDGLNLGMLDYQLELSLVIQRIINVMTVIVWSLKSVTFFCVAMTPWIVIHPFFPPSPTLCSVEASQIFNMVII